MNNLLEKLDQELPKEKYNKDFWNTYKEKFSLERIDSPEGRTYRVSQITGEVFSLPSVTSFLSKTSDKKFLETWKKKVGEEEAKRISLRATNRGTKFHGLVESYIKDKVDPGTKDFLLIKNLINSRIGEILLVEEYLYSQKLGLAGTVDCVGYFDGILSIIDWKTSTKEKREDWIQDYFIQETAYALMFSEMTGMKVKQIVTVVKLDGDPEPQIFIKKPIDFVRPLLERVNKFKGLN